MGTSLFILICSAAILYDADASPLWSWSTFKSIPYNNEFKDCFTGQCLQAWRCPENAVAVETTTACSERKYGPWVCCVPHSEVPSTAEPPAVIKKVAELLPDGYENSNSSVEEESPTPDWVYVAKKDDLNRENNNASSSLSRQNRPNANIINYGRSHGYSSHHSHGGANGGARNVRNFNNQNEYEKGAPESSLIENKWHDPTFDEHPNKDIPESRQYGHASNSWTKSTKNSWDVDHNQDYSRGHTGNHIVKTTPQSRRSTTKKSWDSDYTSSRKTTNKPTPSSRWSPTKDSWDNDYSSSKRTTTREVKPTPSSRWSSTKESWNRDQTFTIQTNSWEDKATPNVWEKTTKKPWDSTTSTRKSSKTSGYGTTSKSWAKSTKASWDWDIASSTEKSTTASSWVGSTKDSWNLDSNSERKSTPSHQGNSATKRPASNISTRKSTRSSTTTAAYPGRQTVQNGPTRPTTRSSTRNPEFGKHRKF
ncbi:clotting factor B [Caerostris darwini]|uniref:Clotting factor B n=1 Tax=Caerostris darwini TaxID=1538125 RepID=A0AAV4PH42_9ARAC|nr:clotting factor B [Caerostris darwini]